MDQENCETSLKKLGTRENGLPTKIDREYFQDLYSFVPMSQDELSIPFLIHISRNQIVIASLT